MEIERDPINVTIGDKECIAFDDDHTIRDVLRHLIAENGFGEVMDCLQALETVDGLR